MKYDIYDDDGDENWSGSQARLTYSTDCIWQGRKVNIFLLATSKLTLTMMVLWHFISECEKKYK